MAKAKKLPSGNWRCLVYVGMQDGKRKYHSITGPDKRQVELDAAMFQFKKKKAASQPPKAITLGEAIDRYIASKNAVLSPRTIRGYLDIRNLAVQDIMPLPVDQLTSEVVQLSINEYSRTHAPKTVRNVVGLIRAALGMHAPDVRLNITLPQAKKIDVFIPSDHDLKQLLECAGEEMRTVILLAATLGLRRSEICALQWDDINFDAATIRINKAVVVVKDADGDWVVKSTKTTSSTRVLPAPTLLMDHLKSLERESKRVVTLAHPEALTMRFIRLRDKLCLPIRFHDLRHYYASLLLALVLDLCVA